MIQIDVNVIHYLGIEVDDEVELSESLNHK
jgi:hypothetical protein